VNAGELLNAGLDEAMGFLCSLVPGSGGWRFR